MVAAFINYQIELIKYFRGFIYFAPKDNFYRKALYFDC